MRIFGERVGRAGVAVLAVVTLVAVLLGIHGFRTPGLGGLGAVSAAGASTGSGPGATGPVGPTAPSSGGSPAATPSASPSPSSNAAGGSKSKPGPLLSQSPYAPYAFQIYPGSPSQTARLALAGFSFSASPQGNSFQFTLTVKGSSQAPIQRTYPNGYRVYFVEANMGDDAAASEYNFGDDGLVVTDSQGRIVA